jgi:hypothetical protein
MQQFCFIEHQVPHELGHPSRLLSRGIAWLDDCYYQTMAPGTAEYSALKTHDGEPATVAYGSGEYPTSEMLPKVSVAGYVDVSEIHIRLGAHINISRSYMAVFASWANRIVIYGFDEDAPLPVKALQALSCHYD